MRGNKYLAKATWMDGIRFHSKAEAKRYSELLLLLKAGEISSLELQPRYDIAVNGRKCGFYKADFIYYDRASAHFVIEDVKGQRTPLSTLKQKLVEAIYNITITEIGSRSKRNPIKAENAITMTETP